MGEGVEVLTVAGNTKKKEKKKEITDHANQEATPRAGPQSQTDSTEPKHTSRAENTS